MENGFGYQNYEGECGPAALTHAALLLGIPVTMEEAYEALGLSKTKSRIFGTESKNMIHGIQSFGLSASVHDIDNEERAKRKIDEALDNHFVVIVSCENSDHWAVLAGRQGKQYFYIDSSYDSDLIGCCKWKEIGSWLEYTSKKDSEACYYFIVVKPKSNNVHHSITGRIDELCKLYEEDDTLISYWAYYLTDLLDVFDCPEDRKNTISAKEFFNRYRNLIYKVVSKCYLYSDEKELEYEIQNYQKVAELHGLYVSKDMELKAIVKISCLLTLLATGIE